MGHFNPISWNVKPALSSVPCCAGADGCPNAAMRLPGGWLNAASCSSMSELRLQMFDFVKEEASMRLQRMLDCLSPSSYLWLVLPQSNRQQDITS